MNCKNCGCPVLDDFCGKCGQNKNVGKINLKNLLNEVSENIFVINKGLLRTFKTMFLRPEVCVSEFLEGKRKIYIKPLTYLITLSTLYYLISKITGENTWFIDFLSGFELGYDAESKVEFPPVVHWLSANFAYASLILIPIFSLSSYLSFKEKGLNYLEHIVLTAYITGQQAFIYSVFILLKILVNNSFFELFPAIISISYSFWVFLRIFSRGKKTANFFRATLTYILYLIFIVILGFLILFLKYKL